MKIYLVGGAIRDFFLNLPVKDKDWVVVGGTAKILLEKNFQQVGKDFPVFLHPQTHEEYALARQERKLGHGYTGFITNFSSNVTLEEDLIRRDLTVNAIAQDKEGNYIDPFHGIQDIENRLLRHVSESFIEDPLRVLRTARFAAALAHLGFHIARETMMLMCLIVQKNELLHLTSHRIWNETQKALKTDNPHVYFQVLYTCKALKLLFPELHYLYEKNFFLNNRKTLTIKNKNFLLQGLAKISFLTKDINVRFSYLCQFLSKKLIKSDIIKNFYDDFSASVVCKFCQRLNVSSEIRNIAILSSAFYYFLSFIHNQSSKNIVMFFLKIDAWRKPQRLQVLCDLSDFNFYYISKYNCLYREPGVFLKEAFSIINTISVRDILKKGFEGNRIKKELIRLRIQKLELWRKKIYYIK